MPLKIVMKPENETPTVCESCGGGFFCGAQSNDCWCFELELERETLEKLKSKFGNCLCRNCLENLAPEKA